MTNVLRVQLNRTFMNNVAATVQPSRCWIKTARPSRRATAEATQGNEHDEISSQHSSQQPNVASKPEMEESSGDSADSRQLALALARACWETKGEDLMVLHVAPLVYWTQYLIIVTVFSKPQLGAMLAKVEKVAQEAFGRQPAQPAQGRSSWELLDFGDVVVNVLTADQREYYDLESFYGAAEELELPFTDVETDRNSGEWSKSL